MRMKQIIEYSSLMSNGLIERNAMEGNEKISRKEVQKLLQNFSGKFKPLIEEKYFIDVYELNDSRAY